MEEIPTKKESQPKPELAIKREKSLEFIAQYIGDYKSAGDEEAVFMLALVLEHPKWQNEMLEQIRKHKPHVKNPEAILKKLKENYLKWKPQNNKVTKDAVWWTEHLSEMQSNIAKLISYFNPRANETPKKVTIIPSNALLPSTESGQSFHVEDTTLIMSHTENPENFEHEFLHSIINPLTEKLAKLIPEHRIIALASNGLKKEEGYGDNALSLLNEELIRTYNLIKNGEPYRTFADHERLINSLDETSFNKIKATKTKFRERLKTMGIGSFTEFKKRFREYYDMYEKNELRERIYRIYQKFSAEKIINPQVRFADFFKKEIAALTA